MAVKVTVKLPVYVLVGVPEHTLVPELHESHATDSVGVTVIGSDYASVNTFVGYVYDTAK